MNFSACKVPFISGDDDGQGGSESGAVGGASAGSSPSPQSPAPISSPENPSSPSDFGLGYNSGFVLIPVSQLYPPGPIKEAAITTLSYGDRFLSIRSVALDSQGRKVVLANVGDYQNRNLLLFRFGRDEILDRDFGNNGYLELDLTGQTDESMDVLVHSDRSIWIIARSYRNQKSRLSISKVSEAGGLILGPVFLRDFETELGFTRGDLADSHYFAGAVFDRQNRLTVGFNISLKGTYFAKFTEPNHVDQNWGKAVLALPQSMAGFNGGLVIDSQDRVIVASSRATLGGSVFVARFNSDGTPDNGSGEDTSPGTIFGSNGVAQYRFPVTVNPNVKAIAVDSDDNVVVAGTRVYMDPALSYGHKTYNRLYLLKFSSDGELQNGFSDGGLLEFDWGTRFDTIESVNIDSQNRIVVSGYTLARCAPEVATTDMAVNRFFSDGQIDHSIQNYRDPIRSEAIPLLRINHSDNYDDSAFTAVIDAEDRIWIGGDTIKTTYHPDGQYYEFEFWLSYSVID